MDRFRICRSTHKFFRFLFCSQPHTTQRIRSQANQCVCRQAIASQPCQHVRLQANASIGKQTCLHIHPQANASMCKQTCLHIRPQANASMCKQTCPWSRQHGCKWQTRPWPHQHARKEANTFPGSPTHPWSHSHQHARKQANMSIFEVFYFLFVSFR